MQGSRKVRRLRISSQDEDSISSDVNTLQEALSIASLPGLPPHGLLLIRKIDLGVYQARSSAMAVSRLIDERVRSMRYQSVCVDDQEYPQQNIVWFSDAAQAVMCFINLYAQSHVPNAWYWRVVFPSWQPNMNLAEVLLVICKDYSELQSKPFVFAGVIDQLLSQGRVNTVLGAVTTRLSQQLLLDMGLYPYLTSSVSSPKIEQPLYISTRWRAFVTEAINEWGEQDVRTIWLTVNALILQYPSLAESQQLLPQINSVIANSKSERSLLADNEFRKVKAADVNLEIPSHQLENDEGTLNEGGELGLKETKQPEPFQSINALSRLHHQDLPLVPYRESDSSTSIGISVTKNDIDQSSHNADESVLTEHQEDKKITRMLNPYTGLVNSDSCGFAFLISLLELIAMREVLSLNPPLAASNFPLRIIRKMAQRLDIPSNHPVLQAIPELPVANEQAIENFVAPTAWESLITPANSSGNNKCNDLLRFKIKNDSSIGYITDRTHKILLYVGNCEASQLPAWMASYQIRDQVGRHTYPRFENLETTIQLLSSRYLYRYAKMSLRQLSNRQGQIALTKTHLDILFDIKQIDIRIRLAGLDINPGWVPWLALVVQFHYDSGD